MASSNLNSVVLTGNLTKDPDLRQTGAGVPVCELRVASNHTIKKDNEWVSKPNYFQVNVWGAMGENCAKYLSKGSKVAILGRLEWQKWETPEGKTNSRVVIVANQIEFIDKINKGGKSSGDEDTPEDGIPF